MMAELEPDTLQFHYSESKLFNDTGVNVTNFEEGAIDRAAFKRPQIPIIFNGDVNHSKMLFWLVPEGSYYRGQDWGRFPLNDEEINHTLDLGYQTIVDNGLRPYPTNDTLISIAKNRLCEAYDNHIDRYNSYGSEIEGCQAPVQPSYC